MGSGSDTLDPITVAEAWDYILVNGNPSPGIAVLSGFKRGFGWEVKKGKGAKGSTVTLNEYPPAEGTVTFYFWSPEHFAEWRDFREVWNYDPTKKPVAAVEIWHPSLADLDITKVVCKEIGALERESGGYYKVTITLIEYNPPPKKKATATPNGAGAREGKTTRSDPATEAKQAEIARLSAIAFDPKPSEGLL